MSEDIIFTDAQIKQLRENPVYKQFIEDCMERHQDSLKSLIRAENLRDDDMIIKGRIAEQLFAINYIDILIKDQEDNND